MPAVAGALLGTLVLPALIYALALGAGLLVERVARVRLPGALLAPVGFCAGVAAVNWLAALDLGWRVTFPLLVVLAVAGYGVGRRAGLRGRIVPGPAVAGLAVYALYVAPAALSGDWTWAGYNFVNDTAVQFLMVDHLAAHGLAPIGVPEIRTTATEVLTTYLTTSYPTGTHAYLAALTAPLGGEVAALYQGFIASMAGLGAMALAQLGRRSGLGARTAVAVAVVALGANLAYHYALQGNIKEVGMLAAFLVAAAVGREALATEKPVAMAGVLGVVAAGALAIYSTAAAPWIGGVAGLVLLAALVGHGPSLRRRVVPGAAAFVAAFAVLSAPALAGSLTFTRTAIQTVGAGTTIASELGQLERPLELRQVAGIWLAGDYRVPIPSAPMNALTWLLAALCLALLAAAAVQAVRRREAGPALTGLTAAAALVAVTPRLSPYAEGKVLAIASPAILFTALWGAASLRGAVRGRLGQAVPMGLAALAGIGVLASDARAYHWVRLAPADRMRALEDVADRFAGQGPMFLPEFEEYAKYFLRDAVFNGNEPLTPAQPQIRPEAGGYSFGAHYDLDLLAEGYLQQFPLVLLRRGPDVSRPPANYRRAYANAHYEVWRRSAAGPEVRRHLGLQQLADATRRVPCPSLEAILADAAPGDRLVAAVRPPIVRMETAADGIRPAGWRTSIQQGQATPGGPGTAATELELDGGRMRVWVRGSFGREMHVRVDGRRIGTVQGINTPAQWLRVGEVTLRAGRHRVELVRPGGDFAPGDGAPPLVGPVAFEALRPPARLETVAVDEWRSLCGRRLDWVELVGR